MTLLQDFLHSPAPYMLVIFSGALFIGALFLALNVIGEKQKISRRKAYWAGRKNHSSQESRKADLAADQLKKVTSARFTARPLLNQSEAKVLQALESTLSNQNTGWRVFAQVNLGEFLASPDTGAFFAINSKRVDFALMDENFRVAHVLEYQGSGHHEGDSAAARDAVKKEALRRAGVGYHEVVAGNTTPADLKALIRKLVPSERGHRSPVREVATGSR